jgi:hypothetical protein
MDNLVTIWSFPYQHQLLTIRAQMEAEGIKTYTHDELTIQIDPLFSNAIGGIKLIVEKHDERRANEILAEAGYVKKEERRASQLMNRLLNYIEGLPFFSGMDADKRILLIIGLGVVVVAYVIYLLRSCFGLSD